jgi:hypothetical protein
MSFSPNSARPPRCSARRRERSRVNPAGLARLLLALLLLAGSFARAEERSLSLPDGQTIRYQVVDPLTPQVPSARATAIRILRHLVAGGIDEAAQLSNSPQRRREVLDEYRKSVGEEEFRRVFSQYFFPENKVVAEIALGTRRLVVWDLGEAGNHLGGQFFVETGGGFLIDDLPNEERSRLRQVLESFRRERAAR